MKEWKRLTSKENAVIKLVSSLQGSAKARRENGLFVLEGLRICEDALENGVRFTMLFVSDGAADRFSDAAARFAANAAECYRIPDHLFAKISDTKSPQGICAVCAMASKPVGEIDPAGRYVALERLADPANLGAVARTAEALGVSGLLVSADGCDPYSPKALRASMGTFLAAPAAFYGGQSCIRIVEDRPYFDCLCGGSIGSADRAGHFFKRLCTAHR